MNLKTMFSSKRTDWETPPELLAALEAEFGSLFDPCPVSPDFDGLAIPWEERNFINPPYGREIGPWLKKAYEESLLGKLVVCLIPARTDTRWWHSYIMKAQEIRFIKGRITFKGAKRPAPFPSCIVIFWGEKNEPDKN